MGYSLARLILRLLMRLLLRIEICSGAHHLRRPGAFVAVANHLGRIDPALVYYLLDRKDVILLAAEKYRTNRLFAWFGRQFNVLWVDRYNADFATLRAALQRLKQGEVLVLAPEGTRSTTEALLEARPGAVYLAAKANVPILPVAVTGTEDRLVKAQLRRLRRPHIRIWVGEPFDLPPMNGLDRDAAMQAGTDEIMCRIASLLPPQYRGHYADYPRVKELEQLKP